MGCTILAFILTEIAITILEMLDIILRHVVMVWFLRASVPNKDI